MQGKYSPTVSGWYDRDQQWWHKNYVSSEFSLYDKDGYDSYGYDANDKDRAGNHEYDYISCDYGDRLYDDMLSEWYFKDAPTASNI